MKPKIVEYADDTRIPCICEVRTANMIYNGYVIGTISEERNDVDEFDWVIKMDWEKWEKSGLNWNDRFEFMCRTHGICEPSKITVERQEWLLILVTLSIYFLFQHDNSLPAELLTNKQHNAIWRLANNSFTFQAFKKPIKILPKLNSFVLTAFIFRDT